MRCPFCGFEDTQVKDSRPTDDRSAIRRRRFCTSCAARFTTFERVQLRELTVVKKNGDREVFVREKLARSIYVSMRKRPIEPERIERLWENTKYWKAGLEGAGFDVGGRSTPVSETPIVPVIVGERRKTMEFSKALFEAGVMATGIAFPTVPEGKARVRTIMNSEHSRENLDRALEVFRMVAKGSGVL